MAHELKLLLLLSDEVGIVQARDRERRIVREEVERGREGVLREIYKTLGRQPESGSEETAMDKTTGVDSPGKSEEDRGAKEDGEDVMDVASEEKPQPSSPASPPEGVPQFTRGISVEKQDVKNEEVMEVDDNEDEDDDDSDVVEVINDSNLASSAPAPAPASASDPAPEASTEIKDDSEEDDDFEEVF